MLLFLQSFFAFCLLYDRLDCTIITKNHGWVLASRSSKTWPSKGSPPNKKICICLMGLRNTMKNLIQANQPLGLEPP
jgi:hypothetical protein